MAVVWPLVGFASSGHRAATLGSSTLVDATGDAFNGGPDIGTVEITDDSAGKISVTAPIVNRPELTDVDAVQAFFDTDENSGTGGVGGFEYEVAWIQGHQLFMRWDGAQFVAADAKSFTAAYKDGKATFSIDKADFGGSVAFNLVVTHHRRQRRLGVRPRPEHGRVDASEPGRPAAAAASSAAASPAARGQEAGSSRPRR